MFLPGVEISVTWGGRTVHVLGLNIVPQCVALQEGLATLRKFRHWRAQEIGRRLQGHGIPDTYEGARRLAAGTIVGRTHFARLLVQRGVANTVPEVFKRFLVRNRPGHVPGQWAALADAVEWIRSAGGRPVLAHPARYRLTATRMRTLLGEFRECGGEGLEVVSGNAAADEIHTLAGYASRYSLLASCGSDYHGPESGMRRLGEMGPLPASCTPVWHDWSFIPAPNDTETVRHAAWEKAAAGGKG